MFRMIAAAFAVYLLLPEDVTLMRSDSQVMKPVTAGQTLDAANTVINDITGFCERNPDTCDTGKNLLVNAKKAVSDTIKANGGQNEQSLIEEAAPEQINVDNSTRE